MSDKKIKIKEVKEKIYEDKSGNKWKVSIAEKTVDFPKDVKKENESTTNLEVKYKKEDGTGEGKAEIKVKYDGGMFFEGVKLPKKINDTLEFKEDKKLSISGGYRPGFWIALVVGILVLVGLGYWWFASSRKEDKEEEGL